MSEKLRTENARLTAENEVLSERIGFYKFWLWIVIFTALGAAVLWVVAVLP